MIRDVVGKCNKIKLTSVAILDDLGRCVGFAEECIAGEKSRVVGGNGVM